MAEDIVKLGREWEEFCKNTYAEWCETNLHSPIYLYNPAWMYEHEYNRSKKWKKFIYELGNKWWEIRGYAIEWPEFSKESILVIKIEIKQLLDQLDNQTSFLSNPNQMLGTDAVKKLLKMKRKDLLPIAYVELKKGHSIIAWFEILIKVLERGPTIPERQKGKVKFIRKAWINLLKNEPEVADSCVE